VLKLFIDTATQVGSIALFKDNELLGEKIFDERLRHLKILHTEINELMKKNSIDIKQIELIGVDIGPGSFTGIRIGVTTARTLAQLNNSYIEGIPSLDIMKNSYRSETDYICAVMDAKKNRVFAALYERDARITDYLDIEPAELKKIIDRFAPASPVTFIGDGGLKYESELKTINGEAVFIQDLFPTAKFINKILSEKNSFNREYENVKPFYLRKSDAEINKK
jgi:tRNA threonylcarbamoyladenosine biosynthesis protein TsaB